MDSNRVTLNVVGTYVVYLVTDLDIHISLALFEFVGEVLRALVGEVHTLYLVGNIYVVNEVFLKQAPIRDKFIHVSKVL